MKQPGGEEGRGRGEGRGDDLVKDWMNQLKKGDEKK